MPQMGQNQPQMPPKMPTQLPPQQQPQTVVPALQPNPNPQNTPQNIPNNANNQVVPASQVNQQQGPPNQVEQYLHFSEKKKQFEKTLFFVINKLSDSKMKFQVFLDFFFSVDA